MSAPSRYRVVRILGAVVVLALVVWVVGENLRSDDMMNKFDVTEGENTDSR